MTITGNYVVKYQADWIQLPLQEIYLECDTSLAPVTINLFKINETNRFWNVSIHISDISNNANANNITVVAGAGDTIDDVTTSELVINNDGGSAILQIANDISWIALESVTGGSAPAIPIYIDKTYAELQALITASTLVKGAMYRITDFQTIYDQPDYDAGGIPKETFAIKTATVEPLVIQATSVNTVSSQAFSPLYPLDIIEYNHTSEILFGSATSTKGKITQRIDAVGNKFSFDFRKILFKRYETILGSGVFDSYKDTGFTSGEFSVFGTEDLSLDTYQSSYTNNEFFPSTIFGNFRQQWYLNTVLFISAFNNRVDAQARNNTAFSNFSQNTIGTNFINNILGENFRNNNIESLFSNNVTGVNFEYNVIDGSFRDQINIGANFSYNKIGYYCQYNNFGSDFKYNSIKGQAISNTFGDNSENNNFGLYLTQNNFGTGLQSNTINAYCNGNTVGDYCAGNTIGEYFDGNTIGRNFYANSISSGFDGNTLGQNFEGNTISEYFDGNDIENNFYSNLISTSFQNNTILDGFYGNTVMESFSGNTIGNNFYGNNIGTSFRDNICYNFFSNNRIGNYFRDNVICSYFGTVPFEIPPFVPFGNVIADNFKSNVIGTPDIIFPSSLINAEFYSNNIGNDFRNNQIPDGKFAYNVIYNDFLNNTIAEGFSGNSIKGGSFNSIGTNFQNNSIAYGFSTNTIGNNFYVNTIGAEFNNNTIDFNFQFNTVLNGCNNNNIGLGCVYNKIGDDCTGNTIGIGFSYNSIKKDFSANTIANAFANNDINNGFSTNNIVDDMQDNIIANGFFQNTISGSFKKNTILCSAKNNTFETTVSSVLKGDDFSGNTLEIYTSEILCEVFTGNTAYFEYSSISCYQFLNNQVSYLGNCTIKSESFNTNILPCDFLHNNITAKFFNSNSISNLFRGNLVSGTSFSTNDIDTVIDNKFLGDFINNNGISFINNIMQEFTGNIIETFQNNNVQGVFQGNTILSANDNTFRFNFDYNNIGLNLSLNIFDGFFTGNTILDNFQGNSFLPSTNVGLTDFSLATHVYLLYDCEIRRKPDNTLRLCYLNNADVYLTNNLITS